jgi:hypothetical protein
LKAQKTGLEVRIKASMDAAVDVPMLEHFIEDMQKRLPELDFEDMRLALDILGITVYLDGENVEVTGTIDPGIVLTPSSLGSPLSKQQELAYSPDYGLERGQGVR